MLCGARWRWRCRPNRLDSALRRYAPEAVGSRRHLATVVSDWPADTLKADERHVAPPSDEKSGEKGGPPNIHYGRDGLLKPLRRGIVVTDRPMHTSIEQLLAEMHAEPHHTYAPALPKYPSAILALLLTPSFAQHALSEDLPLKAFDRINEGSQVKTLETLIAVVDRLPDPNGLMNGQEGLAYMFCPSLSPMPALTASQVRFNPSAQKPGSITFDAEVLQEPTKRHGHAVQIPLAQTVFSTGQTSTCAYVHFSYDDVTKAMRKHEGWQLESQTLPLQMAKRSTINFELPLVPLTPMRTVRHSMGNIIRQLSAGSRVQTSDGRPPVEESQPASQELEAAVAAYFKALDIAPEPVSVWALIFPRSMFDKPSHSTPVIEPIITMTPDRISRTWQHPGDGATNHYRLLSNSVRALLRRGARISKVISGGGGWGKKAGLLSLDPDAMFSSRDLRGDQGWQFDFSDDSPDSAQDQQRQALGEIVKEGERVMFFISPPGEDILASDFRKDMAEDFRLRLDAGQTSTAFGTIPSTVDALPSGLLDGSSAEPKIQHVPRFFGALSESGIAITLSLNGELKSQTKFDVPYSLLHFLLRGQDKAEHLAESPQVKEESPGASHPASIASSKKSTSSVKQPKGAKQEFKSPKEVQAARHGQRTAEAGKLKEMPRIRRVDVGESSNIRQIIKTRKAPHETAEIASQDARVIHRNELVPDQVDRRGQPLQSPEPTVRQRFKSVLAAPKTNAPNYPYSVFASGSSQAHPKQDRLPDSEKSSATDRQEDGTTGVDRTKAPKILNISKHFKTNTKERPPSGAKIRPIQYSGYAATNVLAQHRSSDPETTTGENSS